MKRLAALILVLVCMFSLAGCLTTDELYGTPVFDTEDIVSITFYKARTGNQAYEVPEEHMQEITAWLGSYIIGAKLVGEQPTGLNSESVKIEYADGRIVETGLDIEVIDEVTYYTECSDRPACYYEILKITE